MKWIVKELLDGYYDESTVSVRIMRRKHAFFWGRGLLPGVLVVCLAIAVLCPAAVVESRGMLDCVAAHVNEHVITVGDVVATLQAVIVQLQEAYAGTELQQKLQSAYEDALRALVERQLIVDAYDKQNQMRIPEWVVDNRVEEIIHSRFDGDRSSLLAALAKDQLGYEAWRGEIREHILVSAMRDLMVASKLKISPARVRTGYNRNLEKYKSPAQVRLRMITLKKEPSADSTAKRELAARLRHELTAGKDFAGLATAHSEGMHAAKGGDWGWLVPEKTLRRELAEVVAALKTGGVSEVIETADELYILRIEGRKDVSVVPFSEVQALIEQDLKRKEGERLYAEWIQRLRKGAYVKVFDVDPFQQSSALHDVR